MTTQTPTNLEPATPFPPRFWWLKRLALAGLVLLVLCVGVRVWWGARVQRQFDDQITARRAAGERIWPADFEPRHVPDLENAAFHLRQAFRSINPNLDFPAQSNWSYRDYLPYPRMWIDMATKAAAADGKALELAHEATRHPNVDWGFAAKQPPWTQAAPFNQLRNLANVLGDSAILAHVQGDDALAIQRIDDLLFLARATNEQPTLVAGLVSYGIDALAQHRIQVIAAELNVADVPPDDVPPAPARPTARPASRQRVRALIARLLDPDERRRRDALIYDSERMASFDYLRWQTRTSRVLHPMFEQDALRWLDRGSAYSAAATQPSWPDSQRVLRAAGLPAGAGAAFGPAAGAGSQAADLAAVAHAMSNMIAPSLDRALLTQFRVLIDRDMAAVALATRLYVIDHAGKFPPNLQALVPEYLTAVPRDVMAADGRSLAYVVVQTKQGPRPVVYSVGDDGVDNTVGRADTIVPPTPMNDYERTVDQWRDLSRYSPPPPPRATPRGEYEMPEDNESPTTAPAVPADSATHPADR